MRMFAFLCSGYLLDSLSLAGSSSESWTVTTDPCGGPLPDGVWGKDVSYFVSREQDCHLCDSNGSSSITVLTSWFDAENHHRISARSPLGPSNGCDSPASMTNVGHIAFAARSRIGQPVESP